MISICSTNLQAKEKYFIIMGAIWVVSKVRLNDFNNNCANGSMKVLKHPAACPSVSKAFVCFQSSFFLLQFFRCYSNQEGFVMFIKKIDVLHFNISMGTQKFFVMKIPCLAGAVTTTCKTHLLNQPCILFKRKRTEALQHDKCIQQGRSKEINKTNNIPCRDPSESTKMTTPKLTKMLSELHRVFMTVKDFLVKQKQNNKKVEKK